VEHERQDRLSTARLSSPEMVIVDLLFASSGIEQEIAERARPLEVAGVGTIPVARAEELLAMKVLSMTNRRLQDRIDAERLIELASVDLNAVRSNLGLIRDRGYHREQDLEAKLSEVLAALEEPD
jgi:hypothetical protein